MPTASSGLTRFWLYSSLKLIIPSTLNLFVVFRTVSKQRIGIAGAAFRYYSNKLPHITPVFIALSPDALLFGRLD
jgi:hypothetical protein